MLGKLIFREKKKKDSTDDKSPPSELFSSFETKISSSTCSEGLCKRPATPLASQWCETNRTVNKSPQLAIQNDKQNEPQPTTDDDGFSESFKIIIYPD